jgi:hypothetical protein
MTVIKHVTEYFMDDQFLLALSISQFEDSVTDDCAVIFA